MRFTDGKRILDIYLKTWQGPANGFSMEWARDFYDTVALDENDVAHVEDVAWPLEGAHDMLHHEGDYDNGEEYDDDFHPRVCLEWELLDAKTGETLDSNVEYERAYRHVDLHDLARCVYRCDGVRDTNVVNGLCPDDTVRVDMEDGSIILLGEDADEDDKGIILYTLYTNKDSFDHDEPILEGQWFHDFRDDADPWMDWDYGLADGVDEGMKTIREDLESLRRVEPVARFVKRLGHTWRPLNDGCFLDVPVDELAGMCVDAWLGLEDKGFASAVLPDDGLRNRFDAFDDDAVQKEWDVFVDDLRSTVESMPLERRAEWFVELNDPATISAHYWVRDGVEYTDPECTRVR